MLRSAAVLAFALVAVAAPARCATYTIHWLLGHKNLDYFEEAAVAFKDAVERGSNGDIRVDIKAQVSDPAADSPSLAEAVASGQAEMGHSFTDTLAARDPRLHVFETPFLFRGYRHMEGVIEGPVGNQLLAGLGEHGLTGLSFTYSGGANGVASTGRAIRGPEDLKGLKVGVFGDPVDSAWLKELGAVPVPFRHEVERVAPMTQAGQIDAVVSTWRNLERSPELAESYRSVGAVGASYLVSVTYANPAFFASLPKKYQDLLMSASREAGRVERARTIELNERARRSLTQDRGVAQVALSAAAAKRFAAAVAPAVRRDIAPLVGESLVESIRKTPDGPAFPTLPSRVVAR